MERQRVFVPYMRRDALRPSPPSYTLAQIEQAAKEYCKFRAPSLNSVQRGLLALELSIFITRLAKREQGKDGER